MIYAVDRYMDILMIKVERETVQRFSGHEDKYHYFDNKELAKAFLRARAMDKHEQAEKELKRARLRVNKCNRKFSPSERTAKP